MRLQLFLLYTNFRIYSMIKKEKGTYTVSNRHQENLLCGADSRKDKDGAAGDRFIRHAAFFHRPYFIQ